MDFEDRNSDIEKRFLSGQTLQEVGDVYGLTRERIRQILVKRGVESSEGGIAIYRAANPPKPRNRKKKIECAPGFRYCRKCGLVDKIENYYHTKAKDGHDVYLHKPCRDAYVKEYLARRKNR